MSWKEVVDRLTIPVLLVVGGVAALLTGHEDIGWILVAGGAGIATPTTATGLIPRRKA